MTGISLKWGRAVPRWFFLASLAALLLRFALLLEHLGSPFAGTPVGDELNYWAWAGRIASGEWRPTGVFYQGPLFPYFLALIKVVFPSFGQVALAALQLLVNWITCLLLLPLLRRWVEDRVALTAAVLALFFSPSVFFALKGVSNTIGMFLMVAGLLALPHEEKGWVRRIVLSGAMLGAGILAVPSSIFLSFAAALFLFLRFPLKRRVLPPLFLLVTVFIVLSPVSVSNYRQDGSLTPISADFGEVFLGGNNPRATGGYTAVFGTTVTDEKRDAEKIARRETGRFLKQSEVSWHFFAKGLDFITGSPWQWLLLEARKACLLFGGVDVPHEFSLARERRDFLFLLWGFPVGGLAVVLLASLGVTARETRRRLMLPLAGAGAFGAICLIFYVANRFAQPFYFFLLPAAAAGLLSLAEPAGRLARLAALLPGVIAALFAGQWMGHPAWEVGYLAKLAIAYDNSGDARMVERTTQRMMLADPKNPIVYEVTGGIAYRHGDLAAALWAMDRAIELDATVPQTRYFRGWLLWQMGREPEALDSMTQVLRLDPHHIEARISRARLLSELGKPEEADREWREGLSLSPDSGELQLGYSEWLDSRGMVANPPENR